MQRLLYCLLLMLAAQVHSRSALGAQEAPNFVIINCDDLGYGDLGCYGHPTIRTPHIDRMAAEGMRLTEFYSSATVCTPSRAGLLTGRLPVRSGMSSSKHGVLFPASLGGLPAEELTIAELLKEKGYATACVGKWHLGHRPQYLPTRNGFDTYLGIPYSNDMDTEQRHEPPTPLMRGEKIIEQPVDQRTLTRRYTHESLDFIRRHKDKPFFLYFAQTFPHVPLHASDDFRDKSARGLYGDVVEELDWSVGQVLQTLREEKLAQRTLVIFTSDNGPWLIKNEHGGSAGLLRDGKGTTWEGGMRVPGIVWWPGRVKPGTTVHYFASQLDLLPTFAALAGAKLPDGLLLDGADISPMLFEGKKLPQRPFFYYAGTRLNAVRKGPWKIHFTTWSPLEKKPAETHETPLLFHLKRDPSERFDVAKDNPQVVANLVAEAERHRETVVPVKLQLEEWAEAPALPAAQRE